MLFVISWPTDCTGGRRWPKVGAFHSSSSRLTNGPFDQLSRVTESHVSSVRPHGKTNKLIRNSTSLTHSCQFQTSPMLHHILWMNGRREVPGSNEVLAVERCDESKFLWMSYLTQIQSTALTTKNNKTTTSYFIRSVVISYIVVTSFFCHRLMSVIGWEATFWNLFCSPRGGRIAMGAGDMPRNKSVWGFRLDSW